MVDFRSFEWPCLVIMIVVVLGFGLYWALRTGFWIWWLVVGITFAIIVILVLSIPTIARKFRISWFR